MLRDLRAQSDFLRPYELLERVLVRHRGREKLLARLGGEAEDAIDELLNQSLAYERMQVPSLTGFLAWIEGEDVEVKRQASSAGDRVRVMTVHGAKGLEAPVVILPDTLAAPPQMRDQILLTDADVPCWTLRRDDEVPPLTAARAGRMERDARERLRLLYVAMTRAESWLIVCGAGTWKEDDQSWYDHIRSGLLASDADTCTFPTGDGLRLIHGTWDAAPRAATPVSAAPAAVPAPPDTPARAPAERLRAVSPSDLGGAKALPGEGLDEAHALRRGRQIHALLEHLPVHPRADWPAMAAALLSGGPDAALSAEIEDLLAETCAVLDAPALAALFAPDALAEVDLTATLPDGRPMHGTIDRLVVTPEPRHLHRLQDQPAMPGAARGHALRPAAPDGRLCPRAGADLPRPPRRCRDPLDPRRHA